MTATVKPSSSTSTTVRLTPSTVIEPFTTTYLQQVARHPDPQIGHGVDDLADGVDVALHDVAAEAVLGPHRSLEVHRLARCAGAEVGATERLVRRRRPPTSRRPRRSR